MMRCHVCRLRVVIWCWTTFSSRKHRWWRWWKI